MRRWNRRFAGFTDLSTAIERSRHKKVVLAEPAWAVAVQIVLGKYGEQKRGENGVVDLVHVDRRMKHLGNVEV